MPWSFLFGVAVGAALIGAWQFRSEITLWWASRK
jgi:hypothetical protein